MDEKSKANNQYSWKKDYDWKQRYSKLYSSRQLKLPKAEEPSRISFMNNDSTPYTALLVRLRAYSATNGGGSVASESSASHSPRMSVLSPRSEEYSSYTSPDTQATQEDGPQRHTAIANSPAKRGSSSQGIWNLPNSTDDLGGNETLLLDMVRARSRELAEEAQNNTLDLPRDDTTADDDDTSEACVHGLSMRMTERSVSRSRVSRISTRRDMDIPSILAFNTNVPAPTHLEIPAFQKISVTPQVEEIPRWSIRRSVCPVCSQKWKDRSSITNVKYSAYQDLWAKISTEWTPKTSRRRRGRPRRRWKDELYKFLKEWPQVTMDREDGRVRGEAFAQQWDDKGLDDDDLGLKKNSSLELPSVIAPARLRTSITIGYVPRPTLASIDEEAGLSHGGLRNSSAVWQLTRARRFRIPKPQMPPPEATAPPSASAPLARKDLDQRVSRFLAE